MGHPFKIGDLVKFDADGDYGIVTKTGFRVYDSGTQPTIEVHWLSCPGLNGNGARYLARNFNLLK